MSAFRKSAKPYPHLCSRHWPPPCPVLRHLRRKCFWRLTSHSFKAIRLVQTNSTWRSSWYPCWLQLPTIHTATGLTASFIRNVPKCLQKPGLALGATVLWTYISSTDPCPQVPSAAPYLHVRKQSHSRSQKISQTF